MRLRIAQVCITCLVVFVKKTVMCTSKGTRDIVLIVKDLRAIMFVEWMIMLSWLHDKYVRIMRMNLFAEILTISCNIYPSYCVCLTNLQYGDDPQTHCAYRARKTFRYACQTDDHVALISLWIMEYQRITHVS